MHSALTHRPLCGKEAQNGSPAAVSWYLIFSSCAPPSSCFRFKSKKRIKSPAGPDFLCERAILFCYLKRTPRILARIAREHRLRCCRALRVRFCFYIQDSTIFLLCQESATSFYGIPIVPLDRSRRARYTVGKKGGLLPCHLHS